MAWNRCNPIVKSEGMSTKELSQVKDVFRVRFLLKQFLILAKECFQRWDSSFEKRVGVCAHLEVYKWNRVKNDFEDFSRRIRIRWNFKDQPSEDFSYKPAFYRKSNWKPPPGHSGSELFLSQLEKDISNNLLDESLFVPSNTFKKEWEALRGLKGDRSIV